MTYSSNETFTWRHYRTDVEMEVIFNPSVPPFLPLEALNSASAGPRTMTITHMVPSEHHAGERVDEEYHYLTKNDGAFVALVSHSLNKILVAFPGMADVPGLGEDQPTRYVLKREQYGVSADIFLQTSVENLHNQSRRVYERQHHDFSDIYPPFDFDWARIGSLQSDQISGRGSMMLHLPDCLGADTSEPDWKQKRETLQLPMTPVQLYQIYSESDLASRQAAVDKPVQGLTMENWAWKNFTTQGFGQAAAVVSWWARDTPQGVGDDSSEDRDSSDGESLCGAQSDCEKD